LQRVRSGDNASTMDKRIPTFQPLTGIYEPSAIQQLPDGRFLVVEDEKRVPFSLLTLGADGRISSAPLNAEPMDGAEDLGKLDDLEALTLDRSGRIYALTSHSRDAEGDEKKSRDKLVRFRVEADRVVAPAVVNGLKPALTAAHPVLAEAAAILDVKTAGGLNIEALEITPDQQRLLVGFRSPLLDRHALIAAVENPAAMFEAGAPPRIAATLITLDLGGHGIRGLAYIASLAGYLLISGPVAKEQVQFQLWFWAGKPGDSAQRLTVPGLAGFEHAEGISAAMIDGQEYIILVSDDGDRKAGRFARYVLLDHGALRPT
jgi:hypothetical protein